MAPVISSHYKGEGEARGCLSHTKLRWLNGSLQPKESLKFFFYPLCIFFSDNFSKYTFYCWSKCFMLKRQPHGFEGQKCQTNCPRIWIEPFLCSASLCTEQQRVMAWEVFNLRISIYKGGNCEGNNKTLDFITWGHCLFPLSNFERVAKLCFF